MNENFVVALKAFHADDAAQERGLSRIDLPRGRYAHVSRSGGFDYVHVYNPQGESAGAKRFRVLA